MGAFAPTVVTTMFPQFVAKINVRGMRLNTFSAGATDGGVWPIALVVAHLTAETFADLTELLFDSTAAAEGNRMNEVVRTTTNTRFI
jgi:hypothetical protein